MTFLVSLALWCAGSVALALLLGAVIDYRDTHESLRPVEATR